MENYNYTYDGRAITKKTFENSVPKDWTKDYDEIKGYSYGYYRANLIGYN